MDTTNSFGMKKDLGAAPVITLCPNCKTTVETLVESPYHRPVILGKWCCNDLCCVPLHRLRTRNNQDNELHRPDLNKQPTHTCPRCAHIFNND